MRDLLGHAGRIFQGLGPKPGIEDSDFLSEVSKRQINSWLKEFHQFRQEINT